MHRWKPTDSTGFLELLAPKGKFVEVGVADIEKIEKELRIVCSCHQDYIEYVKSKKKKLRLSLILLS